jgi:hypothetical protein
VKKKLSAVSYQLSAPATARADSFLRGCRRIAQSYSGGMLGKKMMGKMKLPFM